MNARLTGGAQVELRGLMGPIGGPLFADAQGQLSNLALNRVNPYVNSLLGWVARRGSVSATTRFRIREDRLEADNDVVIESPYVSRRHCAIEVLPDGGCFVRDLGSKDGVYVDGKRIERPTWLNNGDVIFVGDQLLVLLSSGNGTANAEPA